MLYSKVTSTGRLALSRFFLTGCNNISSRAMSSVANLASLEGAMLQRAPADARQQQLLSTLIQPLEDLDYCSLDDNAKALDEVIGLLTEHDKRRREERPTAVAREIIPFHSTSAKKISSMLINSESVDKVVICVRYGESEHNVFEQDLRLQGKDPEEEMLYNEDYPCDPILSKRGFGQALNTARKVADCCNHDTKLMPELVVVSPLKRATMAALLSFPRHSPLSVRGTKWICHPALMEMSNCKNPADKVSSVQELSNIFPGIDYSLLLEQEISDEEKKCNTMNNGQIIPKSESKMDLLARTDSFLSWLQKREERVIVVASHSVWLQAFCGFSMHYEPQEYGKEPFQQGEIRCLAIKFENS